MVETRKAATAAKSGDGSGRATLEDLYSQIQAGQAKELRVILKSDVSGSLGAITHALEQLDQDEIRLNVLLEGAGDITDNDIMLAAASNAIVVGFNTKITDTARRAAEAEGVDVRLYDIIYKLTDDIEAALKGLLEPEIVEVVEGRAEVRQIIRVGKSTVIAGSFVTDGRIVRGGNARVWRSSKVIATDRIESLRRFRDDVREVAGQLRVRHPAWPTSTTSPKATSSNASRRKRSAAWSTADGRRPGARIRALRAPRVRSRTLRCARSRAPGRLRRDVRAAAGSSNSVSQRTERVDELLRQEIGSIVTRDIADPRIGFATITSVETTPDLRHAKVWVSVIGQPAERDAAVAALRHAMPFVRHELGHAASHQAHPRPAHPPRRHRRTRDAHPPAARRHRDGVDPRAGRPGGRIAADARSRACHQADDLAEEPPSAVRPPVPARPRHGRTGTKPARSRKATRPKRSMSVDLTPISTPSRSAVVDRIRGARRVLAVSHENPDADTLGATLGVAHLVEAMGGTADAVCTDPVPPLYEFMAGVERFRTDPDPDAPYDLLVISDCGSLERIGEVGRASCRAVRAAPAGDHRPPRVERRGR